MPSLGADMEDAVLVTWKVKEGDCVKKGDIIAELETVKGDIDVEVFEDGIVERIYAQPGEKLPVGTVLAYIRTEAEMEPAAPAPRPTRPGHRIKASPLARRIAAELGVDLSTIAGSGEGGIIHKVDVEKKAAPPKPAKKEPSKVPVTEREAAPATTAKMRSAIAAAMSRSNREIPHYYLETSIDMSTAMDWLRQENQQRPVERRLLVGALLLKAVALALTDVPMLNGFWAEGGFQPQEAINIGFAISLRQGGLVIPAIHNVDAKSLDEVMEALNDVTLRSRNGKLRSSELTDSTITVTSLGERGVEKVFGVIYPPQVALVGFGRIVDKCWADKGMMGVRPVLTATLAGDHRATDGRIGARFLQSINDHLQHPDQL